MRLFKRPASVPQDESEESPQLRSGERPTALGQQRTSVPKLWPDDDASGVESTGATSRQQAGRPRLTVIAGLRVGETFTLPEKDEFYVGRGREADIRIEDQGVSRIHCRVVRRDGGFFVQDLGSTYGTRVNGAHVGTTPLSSGDRLQLGPTAVLQLGFVAESEETVARRLFVLATRDPLTRAYKRAYFSDRLAAEVSYARRLGTGLAILVIDVDRLKTLNDSCGQAAGDAMLREVAEEIGKCVRPEDLVARYGGDKFAVLLRVGAPNEAGRLAERIRARIESLAIPVRDGTVGVTASIGVAQLSDFGAGDTAESLATLADRHVHRAKQLGRNRVCGG